MPKIGVKEPPWWKDRERAILPKLGRGAGRPWRSSSSKARLLKRDYVETAKWSEIHFSEQELDYQLLIAEVEEGQAGPLADRRSTSSRWSTCAS